MESDVVALMGADADFAAQIMSLAPFAQGLSHGIETLSKGVDIQSNTMVR
jgi:hypothetical protein